MPEPDIVDKIRYAKADYKLTVNRIQDELDSLIKIFAHMRECFENEMMEGLGFKKMGLTESQVKQGAALSKMMTEMVNCKIKWDKASKALADNMTPEEEQDAVIKFLQSQEPAVRWRVLSVVRKWMKSHGEKYNADPDEPAE